MFPSDWIIQHTLSRGARNHQNHCKSRHPQNHCKLIIKIIIANTQNCCHRPHYHCFQLNHSTDSQPKPNQNRSSSQLYHSSAQCIALVIGTTGRHFFKLHVLDMRVWATSSRWSTLFSWSSLMLNIPQCTQTDWLGAHCSDQTPCIPYSHCLFTC